MPAEENVIKIVQISDLHCDGSPAWVDTFDRLIAAISQINPNLIVVTGDLVDSPFPSDFNVVKKSIEQLYRKMPNAHIITVPGNHDYNFKGLNFLRVSFIFDWFYANKLCFGPPDQKGKSADDAAYSFFNRHNVAVFPLNSNGQFSNNFAEGKVDNLAARFTDMSTTFRKTGETKGIDFDKSHKIVILHHHPLPVPNKDSAIDSEQFLFLANAYDLLANVWKIGAHLILHGHKHVSSQCSYKPYPNEKQTIYVSSCGSSAKVGLLNEFKFIALSEGGTCCVSTYTNKKEPTSPFEQAYIYDLIPYGEARKSRYLKIIKDPLVECPVDYILEKKKIVRIREDGLAPIEISFSGIKWSAAAKIDKKNISERFRAEVGRIYGGLFEFTAGAKSESPERWYRPSNPAADVPDTFEYDFKLPEALNFTAPINLHIGYTLLNGYALTKNEHEEAFTTGKGKQQEETSSISCDYPTEFLNLIVQFPSKAFFPKAVYVQSSHIHTLSDEIDKGLLCLDRKYNIDMEETRFLHDKYAVKVHPGLNQIELIVKYPQPQHLYTLRWLIPEDTRTAEITDKELSTAIRLEKEFLKPNSNYVNAFYKELVKSLQSEQWYNKDIKLFLFGYERDKKVLKVVRHPKEHPPQKDLFVGRGAAGKAFKTRISQCWKKSEGDEHGGYRTEEVVKDLNPNSVVALPLAYPRIITDKWNIKNRDLKWRCPVFCVVSIVNTSSGDSMGRHFKIINADEIKKESQKEKDARLSERESNIRLTYNIIEDVLNKTCKKLLN